MAAQGGLRHHRQASPGARLRRLGLRAQRGQPSGLRQRGLRPRCADGGRPDGCARSCRARRSWSARCAIPTAPTSIASRWSRAGSTRMASPRRRSTTSPGPATAKPGADGKLPPVGSTVDVANATYTNDHRQLRCWSAFWEDPEFDPCAAGVLLRARARDPDAALDRLTTPSPLRRDAARGRRAASSQDEPIPRRSGTRRQAEASDAEQRATTSDGARVMGRDHPSLTRPLRVNHTPLKVLLTLPTMASIAIAVACGPVTAADYQVRFPTSPTDVTQPATGVLMHPEYAKAIARTAYVWGWPMVNMTNRRAAITQAPEPGRLNGVLPAAPRGQIAMLSDYIDPGPDLCDLPQSGRRLWSRLLFAR